jgi:hypothetical protein
MLQNFEEWVKKIRKESLHRTDKTRKPLIRNKTKFDRKVQRRRQCIMNGCAPFASPPRVQSAPGVEATARG